MEEQAEVLIMFLRNLADSVEQKVLKKQQLQSIQEFFMSYQFQEQASKDLDNSSINTEFSEKELIKFISLGWYIYQRLLKENLKENND